MKTVPKDSAIEEYTELEALVDERCKRITSGYEPIVLRLLLLIARNTLK